MAVQSNIKITKNFLNLCQHYIVAEWNGISLQPVMENWLLVGVGGTIKRLTARASFQRPYNNQILSAEAVYQFCSKTTQNILFNLIERNTLNLFWDKLACQYEHGKTVPVTSHYHTYAQYRLMRLVMNE